MEVLESQQLRAKNQQVSLSSSLSGMPNEALAQLQGWGEPRSIRYVIENLLSNAFKFTPAGGTIRIDAKALGPQLELIVSDTGPGIPQDELPRIFDLFFQGKNRRNMQQSTGLGLSIVKEIVAIHHGNIDVESQVGNGTSFYVRLPAQQFSAARAA
jgi:cell cycle sensor histidine kinase DivJ